MTDSMTEAIHEFLDEPTTRRMTQQELCKIRYRSDLRYRIDISCDVETAGFVAAAVTAQALGLERSMHHTGILDGDQIEKVELLKRFAQRISEAIAGESVSANAS